MKENLKTLKSKIESLNKNQQIYILQVLKKNNCTISENNSGCFINLTNVSKEVIEELNQYLEHLKIQEKILLENEKTKELYKKEYFNDVQ